MFTLRSDREAVNFSINHDKKTRNNDINQFLFLSIRGLANFEKLLNDICWYAKFL